MEKDAIVAKGAGVGAATRRQVLRGAAGAAGAVALLSMGCRGEGDDPGMPTVSNIRALRRYALAVSGTQVRVLGFSRPGDGGGGLFEFVQTAPVGDQLDDDRGFVIRSQVQALREGRWRRVLSSATVSGAWFGVPGDGTSSATEALMAATTAAASLKARLVLPPGVYRVDGMARLTNLAELAFATDDSEDSRATAVLADPIPELQTTVYYFPTIQGAS